MAEIIPAIIGKDLKEIKSKIDRVANLVNWIQLDVVDGQFAPEKSWQTPEDLEGLHGSFKIEAHLMVEKPEFILEKWILVADRILIHYKSSERIGEIFSDFADSPVEIGLSLLMSTPLSVLDAHMSKLKTVQLMGISEIGYQGQAFNPLVIERVKILRRRFPNVKISVDGGVNLENAKDLIAAGVDNLVVGSAIWQSKNPEAAITEFKSLFEINASSRGEN